MSMDNMLIKVENTEKAICLIIDDHKKHLLGHLKYAWKPRVLKHMIDHLVLWHRAKKMGIPNIKLEVILSSIRGIK
jgi:hypothetical protein